MLNAQTFKAVGGNGDDNSDPGSNGAADAGAKNNCNNDDSKHG